MRRHHTLLHVLLAILLCLAVQLPTAHAGISYTGNIDPADPADWNSNTVGYVGKGEGFSRNDLQVWHFDGSVWTDFDAMDLTYDGAYASFTVTGFSGYAVSAVPEPGTLFLLIAAAAGLLAHARRKWSSK